MTLLFPQRIPQVIWIVVQVGGPVAGRETKPPAHGSFVATMVSGRPLVKEPAWEALWVHRIPWSL